jgi:hypothetical protein
MAFHTPARARPIPRFRPAPIFPISAYGQDFCLPLSGRLMDLMTPGRIVRYFRKRLAAPRDYKMFAFGNMPRKSRIPGCSAKFPSISIERPMGKRNARWSGTGRSNELWKLPQTHSPPWY